MNPVPNSNAATKNTPPRTWTARMIAPLCDKGNETPASFVAKEFTLDSVPQGAELAISAHGLYRCYLNGRRVGNDLLTPGLTNYDNRLAYQVYPVAELLVPGANRIEIWLGDGWFRGQFARDARAVYNCWGSHIAAIAELAADGKTLLATDESWRAGNLPIRKNGIYFGEIYDARVPLHVETDGVRAIDFDTNMLVPHEIAPVREMTPLRPVEQWKDAEGRTVHDFGQNVAGYVRYTVKGSEGAEVRVEHSEVLGPDRFFDNRNYRSAAAHTIFILGKEGEYTYAPQFTFQGYRYARVTITGNAEITALASVPITSMPELKAGFECGDKLVNRLVLNTVWSLYGNFIEVPTDCPQRDERLGWTGDAQIFANTACWLTDSHAFFRKYMKDVLFDQREDGAISHVSPNIWRLHPESGFKEGDSGSTGWGDVVAVIPWVLYTHYGDRDILEECLPGMIRWVDYLWGISDGPIVRPPVSRHKNGFTFGDWLQPVGDNRMPRPTIGNDCAATIYHFISTALIARIAGVLGRKDLQARMQERADEIREAFTDEFIAPSGRLAHNDQTSYALGFLYDLIPEEYREDAKWYFRREVEMADYKIGTGFIGTPALLPALTKLGMDDLAEKVFLQQDVPGWLYQVTKGATTIWERWDAMAPDGSIYEPSMNSYNHYAYGAVCQWLFESVAGITPDPELPGFQRVIIEPAPLPNLNPVRAHHDCAKGRIEAGWTLDGKKAHYTVTLPEGCTGVFRPGLRHVNPVLDGEAVAGDTPVRSGTHTITFELASK